MTKPGYMQAHPLASRCPGGSLARSDRVAVSVRLHRPADVLAPLTAA